MCDRDESMQGVLTKNGCQEEYKTLENCLAAYDRDWTKCQEAMNVFKVCFEHRTDSEKAKFTATFPPNRSHTTKKEWDSLVQSSACIPNESYWAYVHHILHSFSRQPKIQSFKPFLSYRQQIWIRCPDSEETHMHQCINPANIGQEWLLISNECVVSWSMVPTLTEPWTNRQSINQLIN